MLGNRHIILLFISLILASSCKKDQPIKTDLRGNAIFSENCDQRTFHYTLIPSDKELENVNGSGTIHSGGSFIIKQVLIGKYDIYLKPRGVLQKKFANIELTESQDRIDFGPFIPGDLVEDNKVNIDDYRSFSADYGATISDPEYDFLSDFNCDGVIDTTDFSSFAKAYGKTGDEP